MDDVHSSAAKGREGRCIGQGGHTLEGQALSVAGNVHRACTTIAKKAIISRREASSIKHCPDVLLHRAVDEPIYPFCDVIGIDAQYIGTLFLDCLEGFLLVQFELASQVVVRI